MQEIRPLNHICPECGCYTDVDYNMHRFVCGRCNTEVDYTDVLKSPYWPKYYDPFYRATFTVSC